MKKILRNLKKVNQSANWFEFMRLGIISFVFITIIHSYITYIKHELLYYNIYFLIAQIISMFILINFNHWFNGEKAVNLCKKITQILIDISFSTTIALVVSMLIHFIGKFRIVGKR